MLEPSYTQIMQKLNKAGEEKVVTSRYSIVIATARRARQIIEEKDLDTLSKKPIATAVEELYTGKIEIKELKNQQ